MSGKKGERQKAGDRADDGAYVPPAPGGKDKRDRSWDERQRKLRKLTTVTFRYFTPELRDRLKEIEVQHAAKYQVNLLPDEVARYLMERAVEAFERGEIRLPEPGYVGIRKKGRVLYFSLYPDDHPEFRENHE